MVAIFVDFKFGPEPASQWGPDPQNNRKNKIEKLFLSTSQFKWQPLNGSRRMVRKSVKKNGQKRSETDIPKRCENERRSEKKRSKTSETRRKSAKTTGVLFVDRFSAIFQWPYSGGHLGFP